MGGGAQIPTRPDATTTPWQLLGQRLAQYRRDLAARGQGACTDAIADPQRTMLGSHQFERFAKYIRSSRAAFKMILSSVPIQESTASHWIVGRLTSWLVSGCASLRDNVRGVVFLSTDGHGAFVGGPLADPGAGRTGWDGHRRS